MARLLDRRVLLGVRPDPEDPINYTMARIRIHRAHPKPGQPGIKVTEVRVGIAWLLLHAAERTGTPNTPWALEDVLREAGCEELALEPETAATAEGS